MDYKVTENGAAVWYKLVGDSELPVKVGAKYLGRCIPISVND